MTGFMDRVRGGAEKARFEADRLLRVNQAQSELKDLDRRLQTDTAAMGRQVLALHDAGTLTQPELVAACQQLDALRQQISAQKATIERIRQEQPPEAPARTSYGHMCPRCQIRLPDEAGFCATCGSVAVDIAPPPVAPSVTCTRCGAPVPAGATFCSNCGNHIEVAAAPVIATSSAPATAACPSCGTSPPAEADFCPNCGASTSIPAEAERVASELPVHKEALDRIFCPSCGSSIPSEAVFCSECGSSITPASSVVSLVEAPPQVAEGVVAVNTCPSCHGAIPVEAEFCPLCGEPVVGVSEYFVDDEVAPAEELEPDLPEEVVTEGVVEPGEPQTLVYCASCAASMPAEAEFCPECGQPVAAPPDELADEETVLLVEEEPPVPEPEESEAEPEMEEPEAEPELEEPAAEPEPEEPAADIACPSCHASVPEEAEFCPECGEPVVAESEDQQ